MARSLIEVDLPNGGNVAWLIPWLDLETRSPFELLADLAALIPEGEWKATPVADDATDKAVLTGH